MIGFSFSQERLTYGAILDAHRVKARMPNWRGRFSGRSTITPRFRRVIDTLGEAAD
jgi:hypothetical protein